MSTERLVVIDFNDPTLSIPALNIIDGVAKYVTGTIEDGYSFESAQPIDDVKNGFLASHPTGMGGRIDIITGGEFASHNSVDVELDNTDGYSQTLAQNSITMIGSEVSIYVAVGTVMHARYVGEVEDDSDTEDVYTIKIRGANETKHKNIPDGNSVVSSVGKVEYLPLKNGETITGDKTEYIVRTYKEELDGVGNRVPILSIYINYQKYNNGEIPSFVGKYIEPLENSVNGSSIGGSYVISQADDITIVEGNINGVSLWELSLTLDRSLESLITSDFAKPGNYTPFDAYNDNFWMFPEGNYSVGVQAKEIQYSLSDASDYEADAAGNPVLYQYDEGSGEYVEAGVPSYVSGDTITIPDNQNATTYIPIYGAPGSSMPNSTDGGDVFSGDIADYSNIFIGRYLSNSANAATGTVDFKTDLFFNVPDGVDLSLYDDILIGMKYTYNSYTPVGGSETGDLPETISTEGIDAGINITLYTEIDDPISLSITGEPSGKSYRIFPHIGEAFIKIYTNSILNALGEDMNDHEYTNLSPVDNYNTVTGEVKGFPQYMSVEAGAFIGVSQDASKDMSVPVSRIKNNRLYFRLELDPILSNDFRFINMDLRLFALVGVKKVDFSQLYIKKKVASEIPSVSTNVKDVIEDLFDYSGIGYSTAQSPEMVTREEWLIGAIIDKKQSTKTLIQEICRQSFVGVFQRRWGEMTAVAFREQRNGYPVDVLSHDETIVIPGSITVKKTSAARLTNDINLEYGYSSPEGEYKEKYYVSNVSEAAFPSAGADYSAYSNIPSYPDAKNFWESANAAYMDTLTERPAPSSISQCKFFLSSESVLGSSIHFFMENLIEWNTRQKNIISYQVPITEETASIDFLEPVDFKDDIETYGQIVEGYIIGITEGINNLSIEIMTEPVNLVPVYETIEEDNTQTNYIEEDNTDTDLIEEDF